MLSIGDDLWPHEPYLESVKDSWQRPYIGDNAAAFVHGLNKTSRETSQLYSNSTFLVQSSGTGKSRMLHEAAGLVFTIPTNLRHPVESQFYAYPPPDIEMYKKMPHPRSRESKTCLIFFYQYLEALFHVVELKVQSLIADLSINTYESLAIEWRRYLEKEDAKYRQSLYNDVIDRWSEYRVREEEGPIQERALRSLQSLLDILLKLPSTPHYDWISVSATEDVKLLLYYDEAHEMCLRDHGQYHRTIISWVYPCLLNCINSLSSCSTQVMAVFASTFPQIDPAITPKYVYMYHYTTLQAPFNETPFDNSPELENLSKKAWTLDTSSTVYFIAQFGRPLWWTMYESIRSWHESVIESEVIRLGRRKLLCANSQLRSNGGYKSFFPQQLAAVVDMLINVDYEPWPEAVEFQLSLVSRHMRLVYSISTSRTDIHTGYSSEPILAEAAARQLHLWMTRDGDSDVVSKVLLDGFTDFAYSRGVGVSSLMIDRHRRDENLLRILVMAAYVLTVGNAPENCLYVENDEAPLFCKGGSLISFFEHLFPREIATVVLDSLPTNNPTGRPLREVFKDSAIRITHFARAGDRHGETVYAMVEACLRGMGFICQSDDSVVDLMIPIVLDRTQPITVDNLSAIMWQVRRRHYRRMPNLSTVRLFPPNHRRCDAPYISIASDLGPWLDPRMPTVEDIDQMPKDGHDAHPVYSIFTYGCSSRVFDVIGEKEEEGFEMFLKLGVESAYIPPKHDPQVFPISEKASSFWSSGERTYGWFDDAYLQKPPAAKKVDRADHFVTVGVAALLC